MRLYVGYQAYQTDGKELPDPRGQTSGFSQLDLVLGAQTVHVNQAIVTKAGKQAGTIFWYDLNGRVVASRLRAKGYMILDSLARRRSNGAVVMVSWESAGGGDDFASRERALSFVRALLPILPQYLSS
jgi:EpsI family protein